MEETDKALLTTIKRSGFFPKYETKKTETNKQQKKHNKIFP